MSNVELTSQSLIGVGIFSFVYRISNACVRKVPRDSAADNIQAVRNEASIYAILGSDEHIAICTSLGRAVDYVDLKWAINGNLEDYIRINTTRITDAFRLQAGRQIIEAVQYIHSRGVIHSDLCLRQYLLYEDGKARLSDFAAASYEGHEALGMENATHYMPRHPEQPNNVLSDLFALGSTLYELMTGTLPYSGKSDTEIESLYEQEKFPCIDGILCGDVILGCWRKKFNSASAVLEAYDFCNTT